MVGPGADVDGRLCDFERDFLAVFIRISRREGGVPQEISGFAVRGFPQVEWAKFADWPGGGKIW